MSNDTLEWRPATKQEIRRFYRDEFPEYVSQFPSWITYDGPKQFALSFRDRFPVGSNKSKEIPPKDFIRRHTRGSGLGNRLFSSYDEFVSFIESPADNDPRRNQTKSKTWLLDPSLVDQERPVPEAVYYSLDHHEQFWVLAFDIDAKDVAKEEVSENDDPSEIKKEHLAKAGIDEEPPGPVKHPDGTIHSYYYTFDHVRKALSYGFELREWLLETVGFDEVRVFYSGQGCHVYAFSDDPYYKYTYQTRQFLVEYILEKLGIPIDGPVTWDQSRVIRLPFSLHTEVSRVVTEVESPEFNFVKDPIPESF